MTAAAASSMMSTRGSSSNRACYDLRRNPVYQIDMTAASSGKRVAQTKRRVRWRFGFSNADALAEGATGTDCRGEEHDVTLIWSLTSGKRLVLADGKEVHFSMGKATSGKFQTSWTMRGNHVLKIVAYAAPPLKARPGFRQFELFLDGMSFFSMPKIYELGVKAGGGRGGSAVVPYEGRSESGRSGSSPRQASAYNNYSLPREEEMAWAQNVERYERERNIDRGYSESAHVQSSPSPAPAPEARNEAPERSASVPTDLVSDPVSSPGQDLLATPPALLDATPAPVQAATPAQDFDFTPQPAQPPPAPTYNDVAGSILNQYGESPAQQTPQQALPALPPSTNYDQTPAPQPTPQQQQAPQYYGQQQPQQTPQAPPQYYEQQPQQQAAAFASPPPQQQPQPQYYEQQQQPQYGNNQDQYGNQQIQQDQYVTPLKDHHAQQQQGEPISASPSDAENEAPQTIVLAPADASPSGVEEVTKIQEDDVTLAMKKLCNINDITEKPEVELELTMSHNPFDDKNKLRDDQRKVQKAGYVKSKGLPPTTNNWAMSNKCLAEVKESVPKRQVTKEVMKPHAFDPAAAGAGMMVVYGAPAPPPPPQQQQVPQQGYYQQGPPQPQQQQYYQQQAPPQQHDYSQGPPPLGYHAAGGFGAGAHLPGGGYANQQVYAAR